VARTNDYSLQKAAVAARRARQDARARSGRGAAPTSAALIFKRESATEQRRLFGGPFVAYGATVGYVLARRR
jgi:hypothetical protein